MIIFPKKVSLIKQEQTKNYNNYHYEFVKGGKECLERCETFRRQEIKKK